MNRDLVQNQLRDFICRELLKAPTQQIGEHERLITGGILGSYHLVQIALFIEETFGVHIDDADLNADQMDTLSDMSDRILEKDKR